MIQNYQISIYLILPSSLSQRLFSFLRLFLMWRSERALVRLILLSWFLNLKKKIIALFRVGELVSMTTHKTQGPIAKNSNLVSKAFWLFYNEWLESFQNNTYNSSWDWRYTIFSQGPHGPISLTIHSFTFGWRNFDCFQPWSSNTNRNNIKRFKSFVCWLAVGVLLKKTNILNLC